MRNLRLDFGKRIDFCHGLPIQKLHFSVSSDERNVLCQDYRYLLQKTGKTHSLDEAKSVHALAITMGGMPDQEPVFIGNSIISMYDRLGETQMTHKMFERMPERNIVSYNTLISSCSRMGFLEEAWKLFSELRRCEMKPTQFTFGGLLSCCLLDVLQGTQLQALIEKTGMFYAEPFSGTTLLGMYARNGCLEEAVSVFECMLKKNSVTWNSMIAVFGDFGYVGSVMHLLNEMMRSRVHLSPSTFVSVLSCFEDVDIVLGEQIHGLAKKNGFDSVVSVSNCLINMYAKSGRTCLAEKIFEETSVKDVISWNTLIGAMENCGRPSKVLDIFVEMHVTGLLPNETTVVNVLSSFSRSQASSFGELVHAKMIKRRLESGVFSGTALVAFYAQRSKLEEAHVCFDEIKEKSLVSWHSLMMGYSVAGSSVPVSLLREMVCSGLRPNEFSFSIAFKSSPSIESCQLHSLMMKMGYQSHDHALSSLIKAYARNGLLPEALVFAESGGTTLPVVSSNITAWIYNKAGEYDKIQELYASLRDPDNVSWNILIAACSRNGDYKEAFELFHQMRKSRVLPDNYTYVSLISVCTKLCNIALGSSLHGLIMKTDFKLCDTFICNIMIDMYGKCGSLESSVKIFNETVQKNVITWTALISALGQHGHANEALGRFQEMDTAGFKPDKVTFLAVFAACRHVGFVEQGMSLFGEMRSKYGVEPEADHYLLMVDLLANYGHLKEAEQLILQMPIPPNALIWRSFLQGCKKQTDMKTHVFQT